MRGKWNKKKNEWRWWSRVKSSLIYRGWCDLFRDEDCVVTSVLLQHWVSLIWCSMVWQNKLHVTSLLIKAIQFSLHFSLLLILSIYSLDESYYEQQILWQHLFYPLPKYLRRSVLFLFQLPLRFSSETKEMLWLQQKLHFIYIIRFSLQQWGKVWETKK